MSTSYPATITQKGQVVIPKQIRDEFHLRENQKISFEAQKGGGAIILRPQIDIVDFAGVLKPRRKVVSALELRKRMEKEYERP